MNRSAKIILAVILLLAAGWGTVFTVDLVRVKNCGEPLFVIAHNTADDGGSGIYRGLGYYASISKRMNADGGVYTVGAELYLFGKCVAGWWTTEPDFVPDETPEYTLDGTDLIFRGKRYSLAERGPSIRAIDDCVPVGRHLVITGHAGPKNCVYFIFDTQSAVFEPELTGCNLIWRGDDITTALYSFWESIYTYDGRLVKTVEMDTDTEFIRELAFTEDGGLLITIDSETNFRMEHIKPETLREFQK